MINKIKKKFILKKILFTKKKAKYDLKPNTDLL